MGGNPKRRLAVAGGVGLVVGSAVTAAAAVVFEPLKSGVGFWAALDGGIATVVAFGVALTMVGGSRRARRAGAWVAGAAFALLGLGTLLLVAGSVGLPPLTSLEGAWIWPLALLSLLASAAFLRRAARPDR